MRQKRLEEDRELEARAEMQAEARQLDRLGEQGLCLFDRPSLTTKELDHNCNAAWAKEEDAVSHERHRVGRDEEAKVNKYSTAGSLNQPRTSSTTTIFDLPCEIRNLGPEYKEDTQTHESTADQPGCIDPVIEDQAGAEEAKARWLDYLSALMFHRHPQASGIASNNNDDAPIEEDRSRGKRKRKSTDETAIATTPWGGPPRTGNITDPHRENALVTRTSVKALSKPMFRHKAIRELQLNYPLHLQQNL